MDFLRFAQDSQELRSWLTSHLAIKLADIVRQSTTYIEIPAFGLDGLETDPDSAKATSGEGGEVERCWNFSRGRIKLSNVN